MAVLDVNLYVVMFSGIVFMLLPGCNSEATSGAHPNRTIRESYNLQRWPNGQIYYVMHPSLARQDSFLNIFYEITRLIEESSCIRFMKLRSVNNVAMHISDYYGCAFLSTDYVIIYAPSREFPLRCRYPTNIGYRSPSILSLEGDHNGYQALLRRILKIIGLQSEIRREDRDRYLQLPEKLRNDFPKITNWPPKGIDFPQYSLQTAMHYELDPMKDPRINFTTDSLKKFWAAFEWHIDFDAARISALYAAVLPSACSSFDYC